MTSTQPWSCGSQIWQLKGRLYWFKTMNLWMAPIGRELGSRSLTFDNNCKLTKIKVDMRTGIKPHSCTIWVFMWQCSDSKNLFVQELCIFAHRTVCANVAFCIRIMHFCMRMCMYYFAFIMITICDFRSSTPNPQFVSLDPKP